MKKTLIFSIAFGAVASFAMLITPSAHAAKYGMAGCGLGSIAFGDKPGMVQVLAATTNGTSGNQTFGMTSGTSNCTSDGIIKAQIEQEVFVASNLDSLRQEMARGEGEAVNALAHLMGCKAEDTNRFAAVAKSNYNDIFNKSEKSAEWVHWYIKQAIRTDAKLTASCTKVPKI